MAESSLLEARGLTKSFPTAAGPLTVLAGVDLELDRGDALAIVGPSGSGKTTLLNLLGLLEPPSAGSYRLAGEDVSRLSPDQAAARRRERIGFVFQDHLLLPQCTALEHVLIPALGAAAKANPGLVNRARELLVRVGLRDRVEHRPAQLSGGERQRVALARALLMEPALLIADEPTGNLDAATAGQIADLLLDVPASGSAALIVVTHSEALAARFSRRARLNAGRLEAIAA
jgi:lipoprotein-releasing system ATP-binding protein